MIARAGFQSLQKRMTAPTQKSAPRPTSKKHRANCSILAVGVGIAVAFGIAAYMMVKSQDDKKPKRMPKPPPKFSSAQPSVPSKPKDQPIVETQDPNKMYVGGVEVVKYAVSTNGSGAVTERMTLADGRKISKIHPPSPVFDNPADQVIALAVSTKPGESMPPLPDLHGIDKDFAKSLLAPIEINDDDSDEIKVLKAKVIETKAYLVEEIKNGGSMLEALRAHQAEMERIADSRLMAIREMQKLQAKGESEMAQTFAERVNESFRARGIPRIPVPKK